MCRFLSSKFADQDYLYVHYLINLHLTVARDIILLSLQSCYQFFLIWRTFLDEVINKFKEHIPERRDNCSSSLWVDYHYVTVMSSYSDNRSISEVTVSVLEEVDFIYFCVVYMHTCSIIQSSLASDDESFHSATEELDELVGPHPTATDESTPPAIQSHRMDQQETSK